jgi:hypothetical protein
LDPDSGKVCKCKLHLQKDGTEFVVRGFIGFSLLGPFADVISAGGDSAPAHP